MNYIIKLQDKEGHFEIFWNGDTFFSLKGAKECVKRFERCYPANKGLYMIMECKRVRE